jgi:hypothetical protein
VACAAATGADWPVPVGFCEETPCEEEFREEELCEEGFCKAKLDSTSNDSKTITSLARFNVLAPIFGLRGKRKSLHYKVVFIRIQFIQGQEN